MIRPLDRYVLGEFWRIFVATALGFPVLVIIIDVTENLDTYLGRNLTPGRLALSYLYWLPDSMFMVLPAAVLFATVFSIGGFTRHAELTAAKASGISFYRFIAPIFLGALLATLLGLLLSELAPLGNRKRLELLEAQKYSNTSERYNFAYAAERGRVYKIGSLRVPSRTIDGIQVERRGSGPDYPSYVVAASGARYAPDTGWTISGGAMHVITSPSSNITFVFDSLRDQRFTERPEELTAAPKAPADMGYRELGRFIRALARSGADVNELRVERMLKIAIPVTSLVILLFAAPLATSTQRGGTAYGVGVSLATTVVFLMMIQFTKAVGGKGLVPPELAAWLPNILFAIAGAYLFSRIRT